MNLIRFPWIPCGFQLFLAIILTPPDFGPDGMLPWGSQVGTSCLFPQSLPKWKAAF